MMFETACVCYPGYDAIPPPQVEMNLRMDSVKKELMPDTEVLKKLQQDGYTVMKEQGNGFVKVF